MDEAVTVDEKGPKIRPELMETERMYHCVYGDRVLLFFLDEQKFLNCYEIEEPDLVERVRNCDGPIEGTLEEYCAAAKP